MSTYNKNRPSAKIYRKIYETFYGSIPKDDCGRSYEVHHIDGNPFNNVRENLIAVSLQEHYNIHYSQGDYKACAIIAGKLKHSSEEISKLISMQSKKRVENGTHHFLGDNNPSKKKVKDGTHLWQNSEWQKEKARKQVEHGTCNFLGDKVQRKRLENGTHHFLGDNNPSKKKVKDGTHHLLGGSIQRETNKRLLESGQHSTQWKWTCECGKKGLGKSNFTQHKRSKKCSLNNSSIVGAAGGD